MKTSLPLPSKSQNRLWNTVFPRMRSGREHFTAIMSSVSNLPSPLGSMSSRVRLRQYCENSSSGVSAWLSSAMFPVSPMPPVRTAAMRNGSSEVTARIRPDIEPEVSGRGMVRVWLPIPSMRR